MVMQLPFNHFCAVIQLLLCKIGPHILLSGNLIVPFGISPSAGSHEQGNTLQLSNRIVQNHHNLPFQNLVAFLLSSV